jgi:hypothetical protein
MEIKILNLDKLQAARIPIDEDLASRQIMDHCKRDDAVACHLFEMDYKLSHVIGPDGILIVKLESLNSQQKTVCFYAMCLSDAQITACCLAQDEDVDLFCKDYSEAVRFMPSSTIDECIQLAVPFSIRENAKCELSSSASAISAPMAIAKTNMPDVFSTRSFSNLNSLVQSARAESRIAKRISNFNRFEAIAKRAMDFERVISRSRSFDRAMERKLKFDARLEQFSMRRDRMLTRMNADLKRRERIESQLALAKKVAEAAKLRHGLENLFGN